jgi:hypothetical protein
MDEQIGPCWYAIFVGWLVASPDRVDAFDRFHLKEPDERLGDTVYLYYQPASEPSPPRWNSATRWSGELRRRFIEPENARLFCPDRNPSYPSYGICDSRCRLRPVPRGNLLELAGGLRDGRDLKVRL